MKIAGAKTGLGQPGKLEEKHVPAAAKLAEIAVEEAAHDGRVRDVEYGEFGDAAGMEQRGAPGDGSAPIVASEEDFFAAELVGDGDDVGNETCDRVGSDAGRFAA